MTDKSRWMTAAEVLRIVQWYQQRERDDSLRLDDLARELGRTRQLISRKARTLGLTKWRPMTAATREAIGDAARKRIATNGHPRGAKGLIHSPATRAAISASSKKAWADPASVFNSAEHRQKRSDAAVASGLGSTTRGEASYSRAKAGKRADLGGRYFRSRWEANYARYLNLAVAHGQIERWEYECHTFWFTAIKRGTRSYTPDFRVWRRDGSYEWHEVKGWMDQASKTRLSRMRRYYPDERIVVIDAEWFRAARKTGIPVLISGWESE